MLDCLIDGLIDSLKLLPYLLVTFLILEFIEHKLSNKNKKALTKNRKIGPIIGGLLGAFPQCGFSAMASNLFSSRVITIGTLVAIFLSTSDEMLPIMIGEKVDVLVALKIVGFKVLVGIIVGLVVDFFYGKKEKSEEIKIDELCEHEHCDCERHGIFFSSLIHTLKTGLFVLIVNLLINVVIFYVGEENLSNILLQKNLLTYFLVSLVGLIPNCAGSIVITELFLSGLITTGTMMAGLLTGSGLGLLLLLKSNKNIKENISVLLIVYFVGIIVGVILDCLNLNLL